MRANLYLGVGKAALRRAAHLVACHDERCNQKCNASEKAVRRTLLPIWGETIHDIHLRVSMRSRAFGHFLEELSRGEDYRQLLEELDTVEPLLGWTANDFEDELRHGKDGEIEIDEDTGDYLLSVYLAFRSGQRPEPGEDFDAGDDLIRHECLRPLRWPGSPGTYYIRLPSKPELVKIGTSSTSIADRLADQGRMAGIPEPYELLAWEDDPAVERKRHKQFDPLRLTKKRGAGREWFRFDDPIRTHVIDLNATLWRHWDRAR